MLSLKMRENYENCILPFWKGLVDDERGGFYGRVDFDLGVQKDAPKGVIQNSRILWFFSAAYLAYADEEALCYARHAYEFLRRRCLDRENGGLYWTLNADGSPRENLKHTYNHAFAIYALSAYYEATENHEALEIAFELFQLVESLCSDDIGYLDAFSVDFLPAENYPLSARGLLADRTTSTLIHLVEAYTELYRVSGDEAVEQRLRFLLDLFKNKIYNPEKQLLEPFFDHNMVPLADMQSFGHDIEASWLLDKACEVLGDVTLLKETRAYTQQLAQAVYERAFQGNCLITERFGVKTESIRVWWVQAEAIVGFINAYKYTSDPKYIAAAESIWSYISRHFVDKRPGGEWYRELDKMGEPISRRSIADPWKCPYHNGRMCFELSRRGF